MLIRQINSLFFQYLSDMICAVVLFMLVVQWEGLNQCNQKFFVTIRAVSSYVYYLHMYVWTILCFILFKKLAFGLEVFVFTSVGSILLSLIIIIVREKLCVSHKGYT